MDLRHAAFVLLLGSLGLTSAHMPMMPGMGGPSDACSTCLLTVRMVEDLLCDPAATDFLVDFVESKVCPAVGDSVKCHNLAEGLLPTLVQWFRATATPASMCSNMGVCGTALMSVKELTQPALRLRDTAECALCKYVVSEVQLELRDSGAMERIKEAALQVCGQLPAQMAGSCTEFVEAYEPLIAQLVETMDSGTVCGLAGVCVSQALATPPPPLPPALVAAAGRLLAHPPPPPHAVTLMRAMHALHEAGQQPGAAQARTMVGHHSGPMRGLMGLLPGVVAPEARPDIGPLRDTCDYCKMAVLEAHALVANPTIQAEMLNYTHAVCDQFPQMTVQCREYVDLYAPLVFSLLEQYLVPDTLCAQTGMCPPPPHPPHDTAAAEGAGARGEMLPLGPGGDVLSGLLARVRCALGRVADAVRGVLRIGPAEAAA